MKEIHEVRVRYGHDMPSRTIARYADHADAASRAERVEAHGNFQLLMITEVFVQTVPLFEFLGEDTGLEMQALEL
jgi:hypothetical protein